MAKRAPGAASVSTARWAELSRTATAVRAGSPHAAVDLPAPWWRRRAAAALGGGAIAAVLTLSGLQMGDATVHAQADGGLDSRLFSLTNQDRASNGVRSLSYNGTLQSVGEGGAYHCGGITVYGRSVDMIQRNYFSHVIPVCNQYVFPMMSAFGINYRSAGENIGWESGSGDPAGYINQSFMNSSDHRANILNGNYNYMGVGSAYGGSWTGNGSPLAIWMFSEEFAQIGSSAPAPPPTPRPTPRPVGSPPRNSLAPPAPAQPPASTQPPTPVPTPTPAPTPTPVPLSLLPTSAFPLSVFQSGGLLPDSIESVLEAFLIA